MADPVTTTFVLMPAIVMGVVIGLLELFFVHSDEMGMNWLLHGLHAIPVTILFIFVSMNLHWAGTFVGLNLASNFWADLGLRVAIGVVAIFKIAGSAAIAKGSRVGERWYHVLIIGILIMAAPYLWNLITPFVPAFLQ